MANIKVLPDSRELVRKAAGIFSSLAKQAVSAQGRFSVALSGGSTPQPLYVLLAGNAAFDNLPWSKIDFYWGDERMVHPEDLQSNYGTAKKLLLDPREIQDNQAFRIKGDYPPEKAASSYQQVLEAQFSNRPPRFDLILLGMGPDGHTASLFPQTDPVLNPMPGVWVREVYVAKMSSWRVSFTPQLINAAANILLLVSGEEKAPVIQSVLKGTQPPEKYPVQLINPLNGTLTWLLDSGAASLLQ